METTRSNQTDAEPTESGRCGATTRDGTPCEKYPAKGASRCRLHGGASTGPSDTEYLEGNDHAEGNPGGSPPELNTNAEIHGGFGSWLRAYERFDDDTREYVETLAADLRKKAAEHAPDVDAETRAELAREWATLSMMWQRAAADTWCSTGDDAPGRGFVVEREIEIDGGTYTVKRANPALRAEHTIQNRKREISERLRLWPGHREGSSD